MRSHSKSAFAMILFFLIVVIISACGGTYAPIQNGQCGPGRVWVPPEKDSSGNWKEGYCKDM